MITRRQTLLAAFALLYQHTAAQNRQPPSPSSAQGPLFQHDLPDITMDDWQVTVSEVDFPPGRVGRVHHHAGFVLAYVLEGAIVSKVSGEAEKTYHKGEMFFEPPGSTHEVSNNASQTEPARLLAMIFAKKTATLTLPGPA
jgi:quercetin dioxygenase-like cupin family protein